MPELDDNSIDEVFAEDAEQISHILLQCGHAAAASLTPVNRTSPKIPSTSRIHQPLTSVS